ncbi:MAG: cation:proton antiporter [Sandaracinaceae bacterium]|nr:cation:proton antiporter [Sandaracinaceae bacterium]
MAGSLERPGDPGRARRRHRRGQRRPRSLALRRRAAHEPGRQHGAGLHPLPRRLPHQAERSARGGPARGGLATWGVILTAAATFAVLRWGLGWPFERSLLLSVVISSTDAAAIFSILRRQSLPRRLSSTVEIESAANDPMAILLTTISVAALASGERFGAWTVLTFFWMFTVGPIIGYAVARAALWVFDELTPEDRGYYYVLFIGVVLLTYGLTEARAGERDARGVHGRLRDGQPPLRPQAGGPQLLGGLSTIANIGMFVLLGLVVFPREWSALWVEGTILFLVLTFVSRPLAVFVGTLGMRFGMKNRLFASWAGLRGAVPIVLATYPAAAGLALGDEVFNLVFFAVLLSIVVQGSTPGALGQAARALRARPAQAAPQPRAHHDGAERLRSLRGGSARPGRRGGPAHPRPRPAGGRGDHAHHAGPRGGAAQGQQPRARLGSDHRARPRLGRGRRCAPRWSGRSRGSRRRRPSRRRRRPRRRPSRRRRRRRRTPRGRCRRAEARRGHASAGPSLAAGSLGSEPPVRSAVALSSAASVPAR